MILQRKVSWSRKTEEPRNLLLLAGVLLQRGSIYASKETEILALGSGGNIGKDGFGNRKQVQHGLGPS